LPSWSRFRSPRALGFLRLATPTWITARQPPDAGRTAVGEDVRRERRGTLLSPELFAFLRELATNNDREWFAANKARYVAEVQEPALALVEDVGLRLPDVSRHFVADARTSGGSLFRIHRDIRFSKDKSPYKTRSESGSVTRGRATPPPPASTGTSNPQACSWPAGPGTQTATAVPLRQRAGAVLTSALTGEIPQ